MGTMGWVTMTVCASIYYVIPKIYGTEIHSEKIANLHFWLVLVGQLLFSITMWITGIRQGWMWKATDAEGKLVYRNFMDTIAGNYPYWHTRTLAGIIFTVGMVFFVYNVLMTIRKGRALERSEAPAAPSSVSAA
jgi:cytochrome c oxidase cbb3-type subunit 1